PAPLGPVPAPDGPLDVAVVVPAFREGSGGHATIANLVRGLEARGHACSLWLHDPLGTHAAEPDVAATFTRFFGPVGGPLHRSLDGWPGAEVVLATGWQTVHRVLGLPGAGARAYLVQDHEPEFYATSSERLWAAETYRLGLHAITAGPWLAELMREEYGASATPFDLAVDHARYAPGATDASGPEVVAFYARTSTPRRAVALGLLALGELTRRRPQTRVVLFGGAPAMDLPFAARFDGVLGPGALAALYREATVGMVLSLTNYSLIAQEMLACGLACVELDTPSTRAAFGSDAPLELAPATVEGLIGALTRLLDDPGLRARRSEAGLALVAPRTWSRAAEQVEAGLRAAVAVRGQSSTPPPR
ncbi:MAG: glycosyltransferase family 4 protein, partial [Solirubrobacterales bacterium]|nr:glycosyltransferase family 4 protein [Solirubrobacterales bacterium]